MSTSDFKELGERVKAAEREREYKVPAGSYIVLRLDGKAFSRLTKDLRKPLDVRFNDAMDAVALRLCENILGAKAAYVQSDEITLLVTDWERNERNPDVGKVREHWMAGDHQKLVSLSASLAGAHFTVELLKRVSDMDFEEDVLPGIFDSRMLSFKGDDEGRSAALDVFRWRHMDCEKNSVSAVARNEFSSDDLRGVDTHGRKNMLTSVGKSWEQIPAGARNGRLVVRQVKIEPMVYVDRRDGSERKKNVQRRVFTAVDATPEKFLTLLDKAVPAPCSGLRKYP